MKRSDPGTSLNSNPGTQNVLASVQIRFDARYKVDLAPISTYQKVRARRPIAMAPPSEWDSGAGISDQVETQEMCVDF